MSLDHRTRPLESWVLLNPPPLSAMPLSAPPRKKLPRHTIIAMAGAWLVIFALVALAFYGQSRRDDLEGSNGKPASNGKAIAKMQAGFQERYVMGAATTGMLPGRQGLDQLKNLQNGSYLDRLKFVVFTGELIGPEEALEELKNIDKSTGKKEIKADEKEQSLGVILRKLYSDYHSTRFDTPSLTQAERDRLPKVLGWAGELALTPMGADLPDDTATAMGAPAAVALAHSKTPAPERREALLKPAQQMFQLVLLAVTGVFIAGAAGLIGLIVCGFLYAAGFIRPRLFFVEGNVSVYAETFALWMLLFLVMGIGLRFLPVNLPPLLLSSIGGFLSLSALLWPRIRGVPFKTMRREIGLTFGKRPLVEILLGPGCYIMTLPMAFVGMLTTLGLILLYKFLTTGLGEGGGLLAGEDSPSHPIVGHLAGADWWQKLQILLLASVAAPIVEEIMFRGVLYRHLRELTGRFGLLVSVVASSVFVSFIFAVIHPQGIFAVPALMSLAFGFSLAREWRGSLVAPIIAHGINNGLLMMLVFLIFSSG